MTGVEDTLRDEFAMAALTGIITVAWVALAKDVNPATPSLFAKSAYEFADAMLAARALSPLKEEA